MPLPLKGRSVPKISREERSMTVLKETKYTWMLSIRINDKKIEILTEITIDSWDIKIICSISGKEWETDHYFIKLLFD